MKDGEKRWSLCTVVSPAQVLLQDLTLFGRFCVLLPAASLTLMRFGPSADAPEPEAVARGLAPYRSAATLEPTLRGLLVPTMQAYLSACAPQHPDHEMRVTMLVGWSDQVRTRFSACERAGRP